MTELTRQKAKDFIEMEKGQFLFCYGSLEYDLTLSQIKDFVEKRLEEL